MAAVSRDDDSVTTLSELVTRKLCHLGMRALFLTIILASAASAHASQSGRAVRGELERIDNGHATLTFVLKTDSATPRELVETVELPVGMAATAITVSTDGGEPARSVAFASELGKDKYEGIVAAIKDPALLEYESPGRAVLHVFPVRKGMPATVVVELTAAALAEAHVVERLGPSVAFVAAPDLEPATLLVALRETRVSAVPSVDDARLDRR